MNKDIENELKIRKFTSSLFKIVFFLVIGTIVLCCISSKDSDKKDVVSWSLKESIMGEKYPYTIDDLILRCEPISGVNNGVAIWLETIEGDKYGLNGNAQIKFSKDKSYKGYSDNILKNGKSDIYTPEEAEKYCLKTGF